jgi:hypothetical protein
MISGNFQLRVYSSILSCISLWYVIVPKGGKGKQKRWIISIGEYRNPNVKRFGSLNEFSIAKTIKVLSV